MSKSGPKSTPPRRDSVRPSSLSVFPPPARGGHPAYRDGRVVVDPDPSIWETWRDNFLGFLAQLGQVARMFWGALRGGVRRPFEWKAIIEQIEAVGVASLGIVFVASVFIGMVMAVQFAFGLRKFGGMEYTPRVIALSFARELAPTMTAVIVGGRIGAGMAAEMGSMAVTEQIDAVRALGADPLKKLVFPRLVASVLVLPLLGGIALVLGVGGAMLIADTQFGIPYPFFLRSALSVVSMMDFISGLIKTPVFGALIALIGCHLGMNTRGGTAGVGASTTRTVVAISIAIFVSDFFLTKLVIIL
ncbi:MAG TPA: ABC transporter permease, partial [Polyangiaceae bacterium]|nr:ABC transporter permease [Polyangiaceae bacterium]